MQCPYCGYEYNDTELKCPFCGTENTEEARAQQRKTIWSLEEEHHDIRENLPKRLKKEADLKVRKAGFGILRVLAVILIITITVNVAARLFMDYADRKNIEKLENYFQTQNYDALTELMDDIGAAGTAYEKYTEVVRVYRDLTYAREELGWYYEGESYGYETEELVQYLAFAISDCVNAIAEAQYCLDDQLMLGNEDTLSELQLQAHDMLTSTLLLNSEEYTDAIEQAEYYYSPDAAMPLAELSYERMHADQ